MKKTQFLRLFTQFCIATLPLFLTLTTRVAAQENQESYRIKAGEKWGLALFIEAFAEGDTLFELRDCKMEYLHFIDGKKYEYATYDRKITGNYIIEKDSFLILQNEKGKVVRTLEFYGQSKDSLVLMDITQRNNYLEVYKICGENSEKEYFDSRQIYQETQADGLLLGLQMYKSPVLEIGLAKARWAWNKHFFAASLGLEVAPFNSSFKEEIEIRQLPLGDTGQFRNDTLQLSPWNNYYGLNLSFWTQGYAAFGLGATVHTDFEKVNTGLRFMAGVSPKRLLGKAGNALHLVYSYNFLFIGEGKEIIQNLNRHAFSLRMVIPYKKQNKEVRRIQKETY
ncbi:hypothetical protein [Hugenholtzia roseola]|uniref:hypothetical protein n=1 Tax=Hugenholtzia roseola TaxID=1002 RepID=UPI00040E89E8|nr:hypothetical protein [Hugenholtzia roseola]